MPTIHVASSVIITVKGNFALHAFSHSPPSFFFFCIAYGWQTKLRHRLLCLYLIFRSLGAKVLEIWLASLAPAVRCRTNAFGDGLWRAPPGWKSWKLTKYKLFTSLSGYPLWPVVFRSSPCTSPSTLFNFGEKLHRSCKHYNITGLLLQWCESSDSGILHKYTFSRKLEGFIINIINFIIIFIFHTTTLKEKPTPNPDILLCLNQLSHNVWFNSILRII